MPGRRKISTDATTGAPSGEKTSLAGTELVPISGSQVTLISSIAAYIRTLTQTLTGKTINLTDNTLTGTKAQFNTAVSDGNIAFDAFKTIVVSGQSDIVADSDTDSLTIAAGSNITLTTNATTDTLTIAASGGGGNSFETIAVSGQSNVVADSATDTLTLVAGSNITITTNAGADSITIAGGAGTAVATDPIFDAKGDLAVGTGANTAAKLTAGTDGYILSANSGEATGLEWIANSGGGRALIATSSPTGTGTVTFNSIPGTYTHLIVEYLVRSTRAAQTDDPMTIKFNNDGTAGNYRKMQQQAYATSTNDASGADSNDAPANPPAANSPAGGAATGVLRIPFYALTAFNKMALGQDVSRRDTSSVNLLVVDYGLEWESTAAITRIDYVLANGNFETGSIFNLYGEM